MRLEDLQTNGRRLDLSNDQVIAALNKLMRPVLGGGAASGNWSNDTFRLILDLDRITGSPQQIYDIVMSSKRLCTAGRSSKGEDRYKRTAKLFNSMLGKARSQNDQRLAKHVCIDGIWQMRNTYGGLTFNKEK